MATESPAQIFRAEASCSICSDFFREPVSIHCGHTFCRACITRRWQGDRETFSCPRCHQAAPEKNLRPNRELANVIEVAKRWSLKAAKGRSGERRCEEHHEVLKLFCEDDQVLICLVCREDHAHRLHAVVPVEEAAEEDKEKLQVHLKILKDRKQKLLDLKTAEEKKSLDLLDQVETARRDVAAQVEELHRLVEGHGGLLLDRLAKLDQEITRRRDEAIGGLLEEISSVGEKIRDLEEKCLQPACEFLQDSRNILRRLEEDGAQKLEETSPELGEEPTGCPPPPPPPPPPNVALREMLLRFRASLTLDPDTAHPSLVLSEDFKGVRWEETRRPRPDHPKRFDSSRCVLANEVLVAGRRYWEVAVGAGGEAWAVGVAKESVKRKGRVKVNPEAGIWAVGRCGRRYQALMAPPVEVLVASPPEVVGVYVDYEAGRVGFYDAVRWEAIFTFPPEDFVGVKLLPLFCLGRGGEFTLLP